MAKSRPRTTKARTTKARSKTRPPKATVSVAEREGDLIDGLGFVLDTPIEEELSHSFLEYAFSVIISRALPDARDGLKPVQRRILYAMWNQGNTSGKPYRKSMATVGETLKRYHPHGDASVYDAMVRQAQSHSLRVPLIDGHGNWGSLDDSAAAARYTEARLAPAGEDLLHDVAEDTVDMVANFDGSTTEPSVLPAALPNLLINGATGIAVGLATNIAPHNPGEVAEAARRWFANPKVTDEELLDAVEGPDFPCGGIAWPKSDIKDAYRTGRGTFKVRATTEIVHEGRTRSIVATELPPNVGPERVIAKIKEQVNAKRLVGISDVRDLSDRESGMRLVIDVKSGFDPQAVREALWKLTPLEETFGANFVAIVGHKPLTCTFADLVRIWCEHRVEVIHRRSAWRCSRAEARLHIVEALIAALDAIDEVVAIIRSSQSTDSARTKLRKLLKLDEEQANAILDMPLRRLTRLEAGKLNSEAAELAKTIKGLRAILGSDAKKRKVASEELDELISELDVARRTQVLGAAPKVDVAPAIAAPGGGTGKVGAIADVATVVVVGGGRIGRYDPTVERSGRAKLVAGGVKVATSARSRVAVITNLGRWVALDVVEIPEFDITKPGVTWGGSISDHVAFETGEHAVGVVAADGDAPVAMLTAGGVVKRLNPEDHPKRDEDTIIRLDDDEVVFAQRCDDDHHIVAVSSAGQLLRFPADKVRPQGRSSAGMAGMRVGDDKVVAGGICGSDAAAGEGPLVTLVTDGGNAKSGFVGDYPAKGRGTGGVRAIALKSADSEVVAAAIGERPVVVGARNKVLEAELGTRRDSSGVVLDGLGSDPYAIDAL